MRSYYFDFNLCTDAMDVEFRSEHLVKDYTEEIVHINVSSI